MGFAKYHEDNIKLYEERMYYKTAPAFYPCVREAYAPKHIYKYRCPFCSSGFDNESAIAKHVIVNHGGKYSFIYLNDRRVYDQEESAKCIYSLALYCFNEKPVEVRIKDDFNREYTFWTQAGKFEYNIQNYLKNNIFSCVTISVSGEEYTLKQLLDINVVSIDKILSGKYVSDLFYEQISEEMFSQKEYLSFLKMLINEGRDTSDVMIRIKMMNYDWDEDTRQLYWYHYLASEQNDMIPDSELPVLKAVHYMMLGDFGDAKAEIEQGNLIKNDKAGCLLALGYLAGDPLTVGFQRETYTPVGLLGTLNKVLEHFYNIEKSGDGSIDVEIDEISVFNKYPVISSLLELNSAINKGIEIKQPTYEMLKGLSPLTPIAYCRGLNDEQAKEKILKSAAKVHPESGLLKQLALDNDYGWVYRRVSVNDGRIYKEAVKKVNNSSKHKLTQQFIDEYPLSDEIVVTPLGGESNVGASCFVVSYRGVNIMLDCGINPYKKGEEAYPALDDYTKQIDYIIISHAHIDHSGALVKAHAIWPNAKIYMTAPTMVFVKYILSDMAKVNNGINNDFEIDIVEIEKNTMMETLEAINIIDFDEGVELADGVSVKLHQAGHIQGAAMIELSIDGKKLLYTGDFATKAQELTEGLHYAGLPQNVDYLLAESTYVGKSIEDKSKLIDDLQKQILSALKRGKPVILPAMAVGRSQELACIIGNMKLEGMIAADVELYLAGMAIPTTTQIIPFMNEKYEEVIGQFNEFDGVEYPGKRSVVIASSAAMTRGSASYKIAKYWKDTNVNFEILYVSSIDGRTEHELDSFGGGSVDMVHYSLPTHSDECGLKEIISYTSPKLISFVHQGRPEAMTTFSNSVLEAFDGDVIIKRLNRKEEVEPFNLYDLIKEESSYENL
ncbi:MBL fold metallo-hydrolase [Butyrivibrio sp. YAB3001]|uniref:MBL fold metallo-hydrolase n=1 Tax=Butyrivibrio sp. YAB3001 TaxID=1520812 RepID=UPI0008F670D1|nr:MBL fold metallo-hydrolase [Butyrivibrio sp. YAB3001]SFC66634.1 RNA processing exonuclease, beta-lactamase fold, Cft2 family [Butyrivibrio sp. YAB3001]